MIFHYVVNGPIRYFKYFTISLYHLVHNGKVNPDKVHITMGKEFYEHYEKDVLALKKIFPFHDKVVDWPLINKHNCLKRLEGLNRNEVVCQIDTDCVFMGTQEGLSMYENTVKGGINKPVIYLWKHKKKEKHNHYQSRKGLLIPYFRDNPKMYEMFFESIFPCETDETMMDRYGEKGIGVWSHGGLMFFPPNFLNLHEEICEKMRAFGTISPCDETPIVSLYDASDLRIVNLRENNTFKTSHIIGPDALSFDPKAYKATDFLHFAGDHYRLHNEFNKALIDEEFERVWSTLY